MREPTGTVVAMNAVRQALPRRSNGALFRGCRPSLRMEALFRGMEKYYLNEMFVFYSMPWLGARQSVAGARRELR